MDHRPQLQRIPSKPLSKFSFRSGGRGPPSGNPGHQPSHPWLHGNGYCPAVTWSCVLRDDWAPDSPQVKIDIGSGAREPGTHPNAELRNSSAAAISGAPVGTFKEETELPIVARLRLGSRAIVADQESLCLFLAAEH